MSETKNTTPDAETLDVFRELLERTRRIEQSQAAPPVQPMELRTFEELERWADRAARSEMVPKDYKQKPDNIILAVQLGAELGLRPMQAIQNIAVIGGRPCVWGDAMLALCMTHPLYVSCREWFTGDGETLTAHCEVMRKGEPPKLQSYGVMDAKIAKLWMKKGYQGQDTPWVTNPKRMLQMRARGFSLRDAFPDRLRGLVSAEEASDYEPIHDDPPRQSAAPQPTAAPDPQAQPTPKRRMLSEFIAELEAELQAAAAAETVDAILAREDVQRALDMARNGSKAKLDHIIADALRRTAEKPAGASDEELFADADQAGMEV